MRVRLQELGRVITGNTPSKSVTEYWLSPDICFIKPDSIRDYGITEISGSNEHLSNCARSKARIVGKSAVLVTCIGSIGKIGITASGEYAFNQQINAIESNNKINPRYLAYALLFAKPRLIEIANAPVVPIINKAQFGDFELSIESDLSKQVSIVQTLDAVSKIIAMRQRQLRALDTLIKARFVEMFGDQEQFESAPLDNSVEEMFIGPFGSSLKNECFVPPDQGFCIVYEQKHAIRKTMDVETRYVDEHKYKELQRFTVRGGDIIVSCRGTIGETFIVPDDAPMGIMHPSIMKIRLKSERYDRVFFDHLLQSILKQHEAEANGSGVKMAITATALGQEMFIIPPLSVQRQFAAFVSQVDKSKAVVQKALDEAQLLFDSLMQEYFG